MRGFDIFATERPSYLLILLSMIYSVFVLVSGDGQTEATEFGKSVVLPHLRPS